MTTPLRGAGNVNRKGDHVMVTINRGDLVRFTVPLYTKYGDPADVWHGRGFVASVGESIVVIDGIDGNRDWCRPDEIHHVNGEKVAEVQTHQTHAAFMERPCGRCGHRADDHSDADVCMRHWCDCNQFTEFTNHE